LELLQANEDRARVTSFYLVTLGGFLAALFGSQMQNLMVPHVYWAFAALFGILFLASILTLLQLIRLREAWFDSVAAMNQIKSYYQDKLSGLELDQAFAWKATTIPAKYKRWSVGFLLALQVALLGGASAGAAVVFVGLTRGTWWWGWAAVAAIVGLGMQMVAYWVLLRGWATGPKPMRPQAKAHTAAGR
jgi:hypothetical protein